MPPEPPVEEPEELGGEGLAVFAEEGAGEDDGPEKALLADNGGSVAPVEESEVPDVRDDRDVPIGAGTVDRAIAQSGVQVPDREDTSEETHGGLSQPGGDDEEPLAVDESPGQSEPLALSAESVMAETAEVESPVIGRDEEPAEEGREVGISVDSSPGGEQLQAPEPAGPAAASITSPPVPVSSDEAPVQPVERAYLDDPDQMITYWIRAALTVALAMFLLIVLFWALGRLGESVGEVWDIFKSGP
jgi:hypothetical protein